MLTDQTKDRLRKSVRWTDALLRSMEVSLQREDPANVWKYGGYRQFARKYNQILAEVFGTLPVPAILDVLLNRLEKVKGEYLFPGRVPDSPIVKVNAAHTATLKRSKVAPFNIITVLAAGKL